MRGKVVVVQATLLILVFDLVQYAQARQKASTPSSIKVDVNLVLVPVAITNSQGHFVQGLHAEDFQIWEDKVEQKIEYFSSEDTPVSLALVFDMSGSMERKLAAAREAATACLKTGNSEDDYLLVEFGDRARIAQDFTTKVGTLQSHLTFTSAQGYTAFLDAVYLALENVKFSKTPRKALLMITDGEDNHSRYSFSNVKEFLNESDVQLYAIGTLNVPYLKSGNSVGRALLEELADVSGGRAFFLNSVDELEDICNTIALELKNQYVLGYVSTNPSTGEKWRKLRVKVKPPAGVSHLNVRVKAGYYATGRNDW